MSSMRNAAARRNHKERSQPEARQKWGILEKHKDYSLRAKDYNLKKQKLNVLSQKSRERHPDEFAYGMLSADKGVQGKHGRGDQKTNQLSHDAVKLLKTQDSGYLRTVAAQGRKEIERLNEGVSLVNAMKMRARENVRGKIVFDGDGQPLWKRSRLSAKDRDEALAESHQNAEEDGGENSADSGADDSELDNVAPVQKSRKQLEQKQAMSSKLKAEKRRRTALRERRAARLIQLKKRQKEILAAADQLDLQRAKMARAIGGINKNGIKFKVRERKR